MQSNPSSLIANEAPANAVDAIVADACDAQRNAGVMPAPVDCRQFIQPIVERLDNKPMPKTGATEKKPDAVEKEFYRKGGTPGVFDEFEIERKPKAQIVTSTVMRDLGSRIIAKRLRRLRADPEWMQKVKSTVNPLAINGLLGEDARRKACEATMTLIKDSCRAFGPLDDRGHSPVRFSGQSKR